MTLCAIHSGTTLLEQSAGRKKRSQFSREMGWAAAQWGSPKALGCPGIFILQCWACAAASTCQWTVWGEGLSIGTNAATPPSSHSLCTQGNLCIIVFKLCKVCDKPETKDDWSGPWLLTWDFVTPASWIWASTGVLWPCVPVIKSWTLE